MVTFRFFSNRVFGVPVQGNLIKLKPKSNSASVGAYYNGVEWTATLSLRTLVLYPHGHPKAGEEVRLKDLINESGTAQRDTQPDPVL